ncbi:MAG: hypothetical protein LBI04_08300 [Treponema sp.]|jgi:hypothetical protein|nr:hypothetical protein [Treponema sp.]
MKKLIAISVMIALIAGAVFAETSVAGAIESRLNVYEGVFGDHGPGYDGGFPKPTTAGSFGTAWIALSGNNDDGTLGGMFRLRGQDIVESDFRWHRVFVWWKPIPQMRVFLGQDADGMFETGQLTSWAFHQGSESFLTVHNWDYWRNIFPGNWDTFGAALSFYLVPGLDLNLVIPTGQPTGWPRHHNAAVTRKSELETIYPGSLQLTAGYNIADVGKVAFAWIGSGENYFADSFEVGKLGKIALSFYSGALVDGLQFQVGGSTDLWKGADDLAPISVGAAVHFGMGDFGVKFRAGCDLDMTDAGGMFITANVMPTYVTPVGKVCLDIGGSFNKANSDADMDYGFWVNPYLKTGLSGGYFQVGIMFLNNINGGQGGNIDVKVDDKPRVYLPIVMGFNF